MNEVKDNVAAAAGTGPTIRPDVAQYQDSKSASGTPTKICGDDVSLLLQGATLDEVYELVSAAIDQAEDDLRGKYGDKNPGQQRMFLGNLLRGGLNSKNEETASAVSSVVEHRRKHFREVIDAREAAEAEAREKVKADKAEAKAKADREKAERVAAREKAKADKAEADAKKAADAEAKAHAKADDAPVKIPTPKAAQ